MEEITARWERDFDNEPDGPVRVHGCLHEVGLVSNGRTGHVEFTDMATARAVAHAILDADRHPMEAKAVARVEIIDLSEQAVTLAGGDPVKAGAQFRAMHDRPMPLHDYRFRDNRPEGGEATYGTLYIARDIAHALQQRRELKAEGL